jgi:hypothetical protein
MLQSQTTPALGSFPHCSKLLCRDQRADEIVVMILWHEQHLVGAGVHQEARGDRLWGVDPQASIDDPEAQPTRRGHAAGVRVARDPRERALLVRGRWQLPHQHVRRLVPAEGLGAGGRHNGEHRLLTVLLEVLEQRRGDLGQPLPPEPADAVPLALWRQVRVLHDDKGLVLERGRAELQGVVHCVADHDAAAV